MTTKILQHIDERKKHKTKTDEYRVIKKIIRLEEKRNRNKSKISKKSMLQ